ncbi:hypothetical protein [Micromonospora narathiwatensis]|uniref:hypothetical protein n=1 Tax=Micromonospora narathiwatensis TaxID=299146 RepID=UPI0012FDA721|nr:hypothetical protein [Micromonospora narathiwatensis]
MGGWSRRAVAVLGAVIAVAAAPAVPAAGHGGRQPIPDAAYYRADLAAVTPQPAGVGVRVDPGGEWIEITNAGPAEVIVLGYSREPYLRITATTVQENQLSQTTYLNRSMFADTLPAGQDPTALAPAWRTVGAKGTARWHDHRIHWMGQARPAAVEADPRHPHPVGDWTVHATAGGQPFTITGRLRWLGKPDADGDRIPQWLLLSLEAAGIVVLLGVGLLTRRRRRDPDPRVTSGAVAAPATDGTAARPG